MISNYMSNYMLECNISGVTISYKGVEDNYTDDIKYPSATFHFESLDDCVKCQKKLNIPPSVPWVLLEKSLTVKLKSEFVKQIYESDNFIDSDTDEPPLPSALSRLSSVSTSHKSVSMSQNNDQNSEDESDESSDETQKHVQSNIVEVESNGSTAG